MLGTRAAWIRVHGGWIPRQICGLFHAPLAYFRTLWCAVGVDPFKAGNFATALWTLIRCYGVLTDPDRFHIQACLILVEKNVPLVFIDQVSIASVTALWRWKSALTAGRTGGCAHLVFPAAYKLFSTVIIQTCCLQSTVHGSGNFIAFHWIISRKSQLAW